jgi:hypothetical protein
MSHGAVVGAVHVSHSLPLEDCSGVEPWAFGPVVNVIDAYCRLETPVAAKGALSVWRLGRAVMEAVQAQLQQAIVVENDVSHLPTARRACARVARRATTMSRPSWRRRQRRRRRRRRRRRSRRRRRRRRRRRKERRRARPWHYPPE